MSELASVLVGRLTREERIWTALAPGLLAASYFLLALLAFALVCLFRGVPRDREVEQKGRTVVLGYLVRHYFFWAVRPLWRVVLWSGLPATALTTLAMLLGLCSGLAAAAGRFALAGWLFLFAGVLDALDGRLARARGEACPRGAAIDSVLDRYTDAALVAGLAWYYRGSWVLVPALLALVGGFLVPYVRARGEGLGLSLKGGTLQRPERVVILGATVALSPVLSAFFWPLEARPQHELAIAGLVVVAVGSNVTALGRLQVLLRTLGGAEAAPMGVRPATLAAGAGLATALDFLFVAWLWGPGRMNPILATALGSLVGSLLGLALAAVARRGDAGSDAPFVGRFLLVGAVATALNAGGVAVLTLSAVPDFLPAWLICRAAVLALWGSPARFGLGAAPARAAPPARAPTTAPPAGG